MHITCMHIKYKTIEACMHIKETHQLGIMSISIITYNVEIRCNRFYKYRKEFRFIICTINTISKH